MIGQKGGKSFSHSWGAPPNRELELNYGHGVIKWKVAGVWELVSGFFLQVNDRLWKWDKASDATGICEFFFLFVFALAGKGKRMHAHAKSERGFEKPPCRGSNPSGRPRSTTWRCRDTLPR